MYVDIAIMCETFAAVFFVFLFGYEDLPNLTQSTLYLFYTIALVMLAVGKNEAQFEEISLHNDENHLKNQTSRLTFNQKIGESQPKSNQFTDKTHYTPPNYAT